MLAEEIMRKGLTVRGAEKLVASHFALNGVTKPTRGGGGGPTPLAPAVQHLQNRLQRHLATHVALHHGDKRGRIEIDYYGQDDLQRILGVLGVPPEEV